MTALSDVDVRRVAHVLGFVLVVAIVGVFVATAVPTAVGADNSYVVLSDSMSPSIDAGSVVFVGATATDSIEEGDVITFEQNGGTNDQRVTHRVVEVIEQDGQQRFRTKGDANEDPDPTLVAPAQVIGVVQFHVPYMGYVTSFAQSKLGLVALVVIPAVLLVVSEMWDLAQATKTDPDDESAEKEGSDEP